MNSDWHNKLYFGDNLDILRDHVADGSVDLIYLDPPFNSKATYNVLFEEKNGTDSAAQITAFEDFWRWDMEAERTFHEVVTAGPKQVADLLQALRRFLGSNDMMAYLTMMAIRLVELHRVLKPTGSIYLHCDPTASHYLKLLMDAVFGPQSFVNEVIWNYISGGISKRAFARKHDVILLYAQDIDNYHFTPLKKRKEKFEDVDESECEEDEKGKFVWYIRPGTNEKVPNGVKSYIDGFMQDVWRVPIVNPQAKERLGYPTQKPEALLERIIKASSNESDLVLDPFCGCGTTVVVAERLHRRWIGIDITHLAITLMKNRIEDTFGGELSDYQVIGEPQDVQSARALARQNRYQFEWWALGLVDARPAHDKKKGADKGIDGYIYFFDDDTDEAKSIVIQVKSGKPSVSHIRDLKGVLEREEAQIAAYLSLEEPTGPMKTEAAEAGFYDPPGLQEEVPRLQILTIEQLLAGKKLEYPKTANQATFKKAPRKRKEKRSQ